MSTDTPIAPDDLTALVELADLWAASVRLRYSRRQYLVTVVRDAACFAVGEGPTVADAVRQALRELEEAEERHLATLVDDNECASCYGSGGGPDAALRCSACSGTGVRIG
ncbi:MAG: hypothetical protein ACO3N4_05400 [Ilumatobacteraceae bacterium]